MEIFFSTCLLNIRYNGMRLNEMLLRIKKGNFGCVVHEDDQIFLNIFVPKRSLLILTLNDSRFLRRLLIEELPLNGWERFRLRSISFRLPLLPAWLEVVPPRIIRRGVRRAARSGSDKEEGPSWLIKFRQSGHGGSWTRLFGVVSSKQSAWKTWPHGRTPAIGRSLFRTIRCELHGDFCRRSL